MFIVTTGSSVLAISNTVEGVKEHLLSIQKKSDEQYTRYYTNSTYYKKSFPTSNSFFASTLRNIKVLDIKDFTVINTDHVTLHNLCKNPDYDVTSQFFTIGQVDVQVGEHITAKVIKKSLKSFGRTVVVNDRVKRNSNTVAPTPVEFKELYDQLARINCTVTGWGSITVAPDSLDDYKMTPKMQSSFTVELVK